MPQQCRVIPNRKRLRRKGQVLNSKPRKVLEKRQSTQIPQPAVYRPLRPMHTSQGMGNRPCQASKSPTRRRKSPSSNTRGTVVLQRKSSSRKEPTKVQETEKASPDRSSPFSNLRYFFPNAQTDTMKTRRLRPRRKPTLTVMPKLPPYKKSHQRQFQTLRSKIPKRSPQHTHRSRRRAPTSPEKAQSRAVLPACRLTTTWTSRSHLSNDSFGVRFPSFLARAAYWKRVSNPLL